MNIWHDINPSRISKDNFVACIEIAAGSKNKYELDKETGMLKLDRILFTATHYPANYGFIPRTYSEDRDPLDVLVICSEAIIPMTLVECKPSGEIKMIDQGSEDEKIVAVCVHDPVYNDVNSINEVPHHIIAEFKHFFEVYKTLENKDTSVTEILGVDVAKKIIDECIVRYQKNFDY